LRFEKELQGLIRALGRGALEDARKRLLEETASSLEAWSFTREPLRGALAWLKERAVLRRKALDALVGSRINVKTSDLKVSGKITKVDGETLGIQRIFRINGQERTGSVATVAFSALPVDQQKRLLNLPPPKTDPENLGEALACLATGHGREAGGQISHIRNSELRSAMEWYMEIRAWRSREHAAETEWRKLVKAAREANASEAARPVWKAVQAFEKAYRGTQEHWRTREERNALNAKLKVLSEGLEELVRGAFGSAVKAFDPVTRRLSLHLTFSKKDHVDLLQRTKGNQGGHQGNRIYMYQAGGPGVFFTRALGTEELDLTIRGRTSSTYRPEWHMGIWLGIPPHPEDAITDRYREGEGLQILWNVAGSFKVVEVGPDGARLVKALPKQMPWRVTLRARLKSNHLSVFMVGKGKDSELLSCDVPTPGRSRSAGIGFGLKGKLTNAITFYQLSVTGVLDEDWIKAAVAKRVGEAKGAD
jgi:hypothetical protein